MFEKLKWLNCFTIKPMTVTIYDNNSACPTLLSCVGATLPVPVVSNTPERVRLNSETLDLHLSFSDASPPSYDELYNFRDATKMENKDALVIVKQRYQPHSKKNSLDRASSFKNDIVAVSSIGLNKREGGRPNVIIRDYFSECHTLINNLGRHCDSNIIKLHLGFENDPGNIAHLPPHEKLSVIWAILLRITHIPTAVLDVDAIFDRVVHHIYTVPDSCEVRKEYFTGIVISEAQYLTTAVNARKAIQLKGEVWRALCHRLLPRITSESLYDKCAVIFQGLDSLWQEYQTVIMQKMILQSARLIDSQEAEYKRLFEKILKRGERFTSSGFYPLLMVYAENSHKTPFFVYQRPILTAYAQKLDNFNERQFLIDVLNQRQFK